MRRVGLAGAGLVLAACGLGYAPGDFLAHDSTTATTPAGDAGPSADGAVIDGSGPPPDGGAAPARVALFGAYRAPLQGESGFVGIAETIQTTIAADGTLGPWTFDVPPPTAGTYLRALVANGKVYLEGVSYFATASFTDHVTDAWTIAPLKNAPITLVNGNGVTADHGWLLDRFGFHDSSDEQTTQYALPILDDGGLGTWNATASANSVQRYNATMIQVGGFVYAFGGYVKAGNTGADQVEVAPYDPNDGGVGNLAAIDPLYAAGAGSVGDAGASYAPYAPVIAAGGGRIVLAGGVGTPSATALSAVVIAARVTDPATGGLEPWVTLPPLPQAMKDFGLVVLPTRIVVFGGTESTGAVHSEVLGLSIAADGTYGTAWATLGKLPGPRSGLAAVTF